MEERSVYGFQRPQGFSMISLYCACPQRIPFRQVCLVMWPWLPVGGPPNVIG